MLNDDDYSNRLSDLLSENVANIFNDQEHGLSLLVQDALNKAIADMISSTTLSESYDDLTGKVSKYLYVRFLENYVFII